MKLPALKDIRARCSPTSGSPTRSSSTSRSSRRFDAPRHPARAAGLRRSSSRRSTTYATKLWDYWERNLDPDLYKDRSFEGAVNGKTVLITGASSGIGRAAALKIAAAGGIPLLVARTEEKLEEVNATRSSTPAGPRYVYPADLSDFDVDRRELVEKLLADHPPIDMLVNNAGRSIRRSVALSYDRFHDYERTIQLNYLGTVKLILALLPHMREQRAATSSTSPRIGVQTNPPRFSRLRRLQGGARRVHARRRARRRSATT